MQPDIIGRPNFLIALNCLLKFDLLLKPDS